MLINSQKMHIAFTSCRRVVASHLKVLAPASSPNTDGIHISATTGVEISRSVIRTGLLTSIQCNISFTHLERYNDLSESLTSYALQIVIVMLLFNS
jgi:hypothetical protein